MTLRDYRVLVQHRNRPDKPFPLAYARHVVKARDAREAGRKALGVPAVVALGDLFISLTVSPLGAPGTKA